MNYLSRFCSTLGRCMLEEEVITLKAPLDLWLLHALWILATPDSFRSVALRFGVRPSTVHNHYLLIVNALCDLALRYITWPSRDERQEIKTRFENYSGFPGIVGCIHGTYRVESIYTWQCGGLAYPTRGCKVVPYAGVSLVAARSSPKRGYVPLVYNASSSHSAFSARLPGWTFVVRSPIEARFHFFHHPFF